jgi:hypothetical protein
MVKIRKLYYSEYTHVTQVKGITSKFVPALSKYYAMKAYRGVDI